LIIAVTQQVSASCRCDGACARAVKPLDHHDCRKFVEYDCKTYCTQSGVARHRRSLSTGCGVCQSGTSCVCSTQSGRRLFGAASSCTCQAPQPALPQPPPLPPPRPPPAPAAGWFVATTNLHDCNNVCNAQSLVCSAAGFESARDQQNTHAKLMAIINAGKAAGDMLPTDTCDPNSSNKSPRFATGSWCFYLSGTDPFACEGTLVLSEARRVCWCHA
jgi:hypothetical protein